MSQDDSAEREPEPDVPLWRWLLWLLVLGVWLALAGLLVAGHLDASDGVATLVVVGAAVGLGLTLLDAVRWLIKRLRAARI